MSIIGYLTDNGFGDAAVKRISEGEEPDAYFSAFIVLRSLFLAIVLTVLIVFRRYFVDIDGAGTFSWLVIALIVSLLHGSVSSAISGSGKIGILATADFINKISRILFQVAAVFLGFGVAGLTGGFVAGMFVGSIVQLRFLDLHFMRFRWRHIKSLSLFSFWVFLISSGSLLFMNADTVMIGYFLKNADVGIYRVIFQFTSFTLLIAVAIRTTLYPKISRWDKIGEKGLIEESLSRAFTYSFILALPMFVGGVLLGDKLLYFFYGSDFANYTTLVILFIVQIVHIFYNFMGTYLTAMGQVKNLFKVTAVSILVNIAMNIALIPMIGISGAAVATLMTMTINTVLAQRYLSQIITIRLERSSMLNILKASTLMGILVGVYRLMIPLSSIWLTLIPIVVGAMVYGVLMLKFDRKIYEELKGILKQMNVA